MKSPSFTISQVVVIALAVIGVVGFYFFGRTLPKEPTLTGNQTQQTQAGEESIDIALLQENAINELLGEEKAEWETTSTKNNLQKANFWSSIDRNDLAAVYRGRWAQEQNSPEEWNLAGDLYVRAYRESEEKDLQQFFLDQSVRSYEQSLAAEETIETKLKLAKVYTDARGEVMKGVLLLQQIVEQEPNHIQANYELGLLSVRSGQTDRALMRFNTLIAEAPTFIEPYIYKAQLLMEQSDEDGAVSTINSALEVAETEEQKAALLNIKNSIINN